MKASHQRHVHQQPLAAETLLAVGTRSLLGSPLRSQLSRVSHGRAPSLQKQQTKPAEEEATSCSIHPSLGVIYRLQTC